MPRQLNKLLLTVGATRIAEAMVQDMVNGYRIFV